MAHIKELNEGQVITIYGHAKRGIPRDGTSTKPIVNTSVKQPDQAGNNGKISVVRKTNKKLSLQNKEDSWHSWITKKDKTLINHSAPSDGKTVDTKTHKINYQKKNPLHQFATYSTLFTLSGLSEAELKNPRLYLKVNKPHDIIARSGGIVNANPRSNLTDRVDLDNPNEMNSYLAKMTTGKRSINAANEILSRAHDIFFENVNILSTAGPSEERNSMNFTKIEFELHEPYGVTFIEKVRAAAYNNRYLDYQDAPMLLTIEWKGFNELGQPVEVSDSLVRKIPILLSRVEFDVDEGGARYSIIAVPYVDIGAYDRFMYPRTKQDIGKSTLLEFGKELEKILDTQMQEEVEANTREYKDIYKIHIHSDLSKLSMTTRGHIKSGHPVLQSNIQRSQNKDSTVQTTSKVSLSPGTAILKTMEDAIRSTPYFKNIVINFWKEYLTGNSIVKDPQFKEGKLSEFFETTAGREILGKTIQSNQFVPWFKIITTVHTNQKDFDSITKMHPKTIIYKAIPYRFHILKLLMPGMSLGKVDWSKYVRKDYNYLYTGENVDVQHIRIKYKTGFYQRNLIKASDGTKIGTAIKMVSSLTSDLVNKLVGQEDQPEPHLPMRSYPSAVSSNGMAYTGDPEDLRATEFYDYLINPEADMMQVELEILGDPGYIAQDMYINIGEDIAEDKTTLLGDGDWAEDEGCFNFEQQMPIIKINYRLPDDLDHAEGLMFDAKKKYLHENLFFNGVYQVTKVMSRIDQGKFTQILTCTRLNNQQGLGGAPFELDKKSRKNLNDNIEKKNGSDDGMPWDYHPDDVFQGGTYN